MSIELVCVICALKADAADATFFFDEANALASRSCPKCTSSATVAVDIFKRFAAARTADKTKVPPTAGQKVEASPERSVDVVARHIASQEASETAKLLRDSHKWAAHVAALRAFLLRGNSQLVQANGWWDGFHFYMEHSWTPEAGSHAVDSLDYVVIKLVNKDKSFKEVLLYINPEDEGFCEVSAEQS